MTEEMEELEIFLEEQIINFTKVRQITTKDFSMLYLFGEYKNNLTVIEKKQLVRIIKKIGKLLYKLKIKYPNNIKNLSRFCYEFTPIKNNRR
jgi:hypothetical protein